MTQLVVNADHAIMRLAEKITYLIVAFDHVARLVENANQRWSVVINSVALMFALIAD